MELHPLLIRKLVQHGLFEARADIVPLPELLDHRNGEDLSHVSFAWPCTEYFVE
jgi:hypothetical protein